MTENTWPFPDRPGVPLNPEKDGWHWVSLLGSDHPQIMEWFSDVMVWAEDWTVQACAMHLRYLGPCLTPEEVAALQARADRNAAEYARVDDKARLAEFLHKQEIAAKDARIAALEAAVIQCKTLSAMLKPQADRIAALEAALAAAQVTALKKAADIARQFAQSEGWSGASALRLRNCIIAESAIYTKAEEKDER